MAMRDREWVHLTLNEQGEPVDSAATLARIRATSLSVCLHPTPGFCLLRRLAATGLSAKEVAPALTLWAEESLPQPLEQYYLDSWAAPPDGHGLAALPRAPLDRARRELQGAGAKHLAIRVPELRPPADARSGVVFWVTSVGLLACLWHNRVLYDWQSFPPGLPARAIVEQVAAGCRIAPAVIYLSWMTSDLFSSWSELQAVWPQAEIVEIWNWGRPELERRFGAGPVFASYLYAEQQQPASGADKVRLSLALGGALAAGMFLFYANLTYLERQAAQLRHNVSLLKVQASRSEKLAARSGEALRQIRELRTMTVERSGVLTVLKTLAEALPPRVKLENLTLERSGTAALDGVAESELDISRLLERLGQTPLFQSPTLTFTQKDEQPNQSGEPQGSGQALVRFRLETRLAQPLLSLPQAEEAGAEDAGGEAEADDTGSEA